MLNNHFDLKGQLLMRHPSASRGILKKLLLACVLLGTLLTSLALYRSVKSQVFFSTSSPGGTYTVHLTGQKSRPIFFTTNEVRFDVVKNGKPFLSNEYLHSGDSFDLSFELGYPDHRWLGDNILQLYREEYFTQGKTDTLVIVNKTGEVVKYLKIESVDKFLIFDLRPASELRLLNSAPRGDYKRIGIEGEFSDGLRIKKSGESIPAHKKMGGPFTYYLYVTADSTIIERSQ